MNITDHNANSVNKSFSFYDSIKISIVYYFLLLLENRPKSCLPQNPCMNNGKCVTTNAGAQCVCQRGTSGILCERSKPMLF